MAEAILVGARVSTGSTISVDGIAMLTGLKLCVSNVFRKSLRKKIVRTWESAAIFSAPLSGVFSIAMGRAPPVISAVNPIAITPEILVGGDLSFGGELWP